MTVQSPSKSARLKELKPFLDRKVDQYNHPSFIENDPISIPHQFSRLQDIEITGFFAAIFAWGQRTTIINKSNKLINLMGGEPYEFVRHHSDNDLKPFEDFAHRTFQPTDALYFIQFFKHFYREYESLEEGFAQFIEPTDETVEPVLYRFHDFFFGLDWVPERTRKHIATPEKNATCKRLNMFLRWMVRQDEKGVDFGLWEKIDPSQLVCPIDVHVNRVARKLGLLERKSTDWKAALELTRNLRQLDPNDPVKYDFALFGLGSREGWGSNATK